jgi:NDP-sugar pyrophosphorylase family protein
VFNGDVLTDIDLAAVVARHRETQALATIVLTPVENPSAYGLVETTPDGSIQRFVEKPGPDEITCNTINAGIYVLEPGVLKYMPKGEPYSFERGLFPTLLEHKERVMSFLFEKYWIDIGTPQKYLEVHEDILSRKFVSPRVALSGLDRSALPPGAFVDETSIVDAEVTIREGVRIETSVIGRNCKIDSGAHIADSVLWSANTVDADARIRGSLIGKGCYVGRSATLRPGVVLGDKTVVTDYSSL